MRTSSTNPSRYWAGHNPLGLAVARSVEDFFYVSRYSAGHNSFGLAVGVACSIEDFFYEPFQVVGLAIILLRPGCRGGAQR